MHAIVEAVAALGRHACMPSTPKTAQAVSQMICTAVVKVYKTCKTLDAGREACTEFLSSSDTHQHPQQAR